MADSNDLISFIASMAGEGNLRVEENLGEGYVRLRVAEAERRQAKHDIQHVEDVVIEMLRNARDAGAQRIYLATQKEEGVRSLLFLDNGSGIPSDMHERVFDARVTSKLESMKMDRWGVHGRGMALYSIRQNCDVARVVCSSPAKGSSIQVRVSTQHLNERADQSSWPKVAKGEDGRWQVVSGPHNIIRTASEFALDELHGTDVYLGSPTEIAATLFSHAVNDVDSSQLLFIDDFEDLSVVQRLACAVDAPSFIRIAASVGIDLSERTAHRILAGSISPLRNLASRLLRERDAVSREPRHIDLAKDRRGLKIAREDIEEFSRAMERDFSDLADRYYLSLVGEPKVRVGKDKITVTFDLDKGE